MKKLKTLPAHWYVCAMQREIQVWRRDRGVRQDNLRAIAIISDRMRAFVTENTYPEI